MVLLFSMLRHNNYDEIIYHIGILYSALNNLDKFIQFYFENTNRKPDQNK